MFKTSDSKFSESRIARAYTRLFSIPEGRDGERTVSLERIGHYEVRLVEMSAINSFDEPTLWLELYAHDEQSAIDSCSCWEFDEAVAVAEEFVSGAKRLHELSQREAHQIAANAPFSRTTVTPD